jgi:ABC-type phosphate transport system substrate-binding protein
MMAGTVSSWTGRVLAALLVLALAPRPAAADPIYVVVSAQSPVRVLAQKDVLALYTGRSRTLPGGEVATPIDQQRDGAVRAEFYQALTGMDIARINSYWARLHFTGQVQPPQAVGDDGAVIQRLRADPGAIGYVASEPQGNAVRVVLRLP